MRKQPLLKVAIIGAKNFPANYGGIETACENLYKRLAKKQMKVLFFCRSEKFKFEKINYNGLKVINFPVLELPGIATFLHCFIATVLATFSDATIIHFHAQGPAVFALIPKLLAPRKKIVFTCHGIDWQREKWGRLAKAIIKIGEVHSVKYTDCQIMVSESLTRHYQSTYGINPYTLSNGVNKLEVRKLDYLKSKFGLEKNRYLLFIGRLVPEKAPDILIEAYSKIKTDIKLVIVGDCSENPKYKQYLEKLASKNSNIIFTSQLRGKNIPEVYSNALAYVSASKLEGNPITALEAMSYALPLIVSDIAPHKEILSLYKNPHEFCFKANSVAACRTMLDKVLETPLERIQQLGEESLQLVEQHFNWDTIADKTQYIYLRELASSSRAKTKNLATVTNLYLEEPSQ
jgi:glycosyltransferase involved in cell wall biosynthesis